MMMDYMDLLFTTVFAFGVVVGFVTAKVFFNEEKSTTDPVDGMAADFAITPKKVISIVEAFCVATNYSTTDTQMLMRYFLRMRCHWLSLKQIAVLTGRKDHSTVIWAIKTVEKEQRFLTARFTLRKMLDEQLGKLKDLTAQS